MKRETDHSLCPFIDDLDEADLVLFLKLVVRHTVAILFPLDLVRNAINHLEALGEFGEDLGL